MTTRTRPTALWFTNDEKACALLAKSPFALLVGWVLDQQVTVQKAFAGPYVLKQRLGTLDAKKIAAMPLADIEAAVAEKPAIHRFPSAMAGRVHALAEVVARDYGGTAADIWETAADTEDVRTRLAALPGFGPLKVAGMLAVLDLRFGYSFGSWEDDAPAYGALGNVDSPESLLEYQERKKAYKAARRAAAK